MKNILYIGPYRHDTIEGVVSRTIISNILSSSDINLTTRALYLDTLPVLRENIDIFETEQVLPSNYDIIVQHAPMPYIQKIHKIKTNVVIPITNNVCINNDAIESLCVFDKILVDNNFDYSKYTRYSKLKNKIYRYDYDIDMPKAISSINAGIYNILKKVYTIIPYDEKQILDMVVAFNIVNQNQDHILLIFIEDATSQQLSQINQKITQLCKDMDREHGRAKINTFQVTPSLDYLAAIGKNMDIYLNINNRTISAKIAKHFNKTIVDFDIGDSYVSFFKNNMYHNTGVTYLSPFVIKSKLLSTQAYSTQHFKISHISKLL